MSKIYIPYKVDKVIKWLHQNQKHLEWSSIWKIEIIDDNYVVTNLYLPKQKNSQAFTEIQDFDEVFDYLAENDMEWMHKWRLRLHSHNTMNPFWSWTDDATRKENSCQRWYDGETWYGISIVIWTKSWKPTYYATLDVCIDWTQYFEDLEVVIWLPNANIFIDPWQLEIPDYIEKPCPNLEFMPEYMKQEFVDLYNKENKSNYNKYIEALEQEHLDNVELLTIAANEEMEEWLLFNDIVSERIKDLESKKIVNVINKFFNYKKKSILYEDDQEEDSFFQWRSKLKIRKSDGSFIKSPYDYKEHRYDYITQRYVFNEEYDDSILN